MISSNRQLQIWNACSEGGNGMNQAEPPHHHAAMPEPAQGCFCVVINSLLCKLHSTMRIEAFLRESPMFTVKREALRFDAIAAEAFSADNLGFMEGLVLAAIFYTTRGNISHSISSLEAKGLLQRKIDPLDARGYLLTLKPAGRKCALRVIAAFDKMQKGFEREVGATTLANALKVIRALESCQH